MICCSCRTLGPIKVQHCELGAEYTYVMADGAGSGIHAGLAALLQLQAECMQTGSVILHAGRHTLLADSFVHYAHIPAVLSLRGAHVEQPFACVQMLRSHVGSQPDLNSLQELFGRQHDLNAVCLPRADSLPAFQKQQKREAQGGSNPN